MVLPGVVGFKLSGKLRNGVTATDLVLTATQMLRKHGDGMGELSLADRATIANMSPEYGATMGFFPVDHVTLQYLKLTGRSDETVAMIESYLRANKMFVDYNEARMFLPFSFLLFVLMNSHHHAVLLVKPWIKTSLAPGSGVVTKYLLQSGLQEYLNKQGFHIVGYGCTTCIGNSGELDESVASAISENDIIAAAVLSGNRNFEGRVHALTRANYLASPPLVVAYALAGTVDINFDKEPIGAGKDGKSIFFKDIWPSTEEVAEAVQYSVLSDMFRSTYQAITKGNPMWNKLSVPSSTFITTDHISPAGSIHKDSPAAKYLLGRGVERKDFNSYGSRRGNDEKGEVGPKTVHVPTGEKLYVFDAAMRYKDAGHDTIVLAGAEYGSGSSRDWAAKGPMLLGVKAVIAKSFERIHRSNLDADSLGLSGHERYTIDLPSKISDIRPGQDVTVKTDNNKSFTCTVRFDTEFCSSERPGLSFFIGLMEPWRYND
ncbi:hypothetical protein GQ457_03G011250 [Hibiscus cannabinus]